MRLITGRALLLAATVVALQSGASADEIEFSAEDARFACKLFIEESLHDPSRAEMVDIHSWVVLPGISNRLVVFPRVRGSNAFGALILTKWGCDVGKEDGGYRIHRLEQLD